MNAEGKVGWEEIVDSRLEGKFDVRELNEIAALAYKCINSVPKKRPSMRDIVQVLSRILKLNQNRRHHDKKSHSATADEVSIDMDQSETKTPVSPSATADEVSIDMDQLEVQTPVSNCHWQEEFMDSVDTCEVSR